MPRKPDLPRRWMIRTLALLSVCILFFLLRLVAESARQVSRPITAGQINQTNLWTDEIFIGGTPFYHRGIDFPGNMGTDVHAVDAGKVVQIYDLTDNNTFGNAAWGNFVVIRHFKTHWDQTNLPNAGPSFVYSIYLHLERGSIDLVVGQDVDANQVIARRDNTGRSTGSHLHLQVVLNPDSGALLIPTNTLDSENKVRNPELWVEPLDNTGIAIGKVTDSNGDPVWNLLVCGIHKDTAGYVSSRTYSFNWANQDDILHENFGTTDVDVQPGLYYIYAID